MNEIVNRAGAKTSEFWFGMATVGLILVNGLESVSIPESHIMLVAGPAGAYGAGPMKRPPRWKSSAVDSPPGASVPGLLLCPIGKRRYDVTQASLSGGPRNQRKVRTRPSFGRLLRLSMASAEGEVLSHGPCPLAPAMSAG